MKKFKKLVIPLILIMTLVVMSGCGDKEKEKIDEVEEEEIEDIAEDFEEPVASDVRSDDNPATNPEVETAEHNELRSAKAFNLEDIYTPAPGMQDVFDKYYHKDYFLNATLTPEQQEQSDAYGGINDYFDIEGFLAELGYVGETYDTQYFTLDTHIETGGWDAAVSFYFDFHNHLGQNQVRYKVNTGFGPLLLAGTINNIALHDDMTYVVTETLIGAICNIYWNARTTQNPLRDTYVCFWISAYYPDSPFEDDYKIREDVCDVSLLMNDPDFEYMFTNVAWYY